MKRLSLLTVIITCLGYLATAQNSNLQLVRMNSQDCYNDDYSNPNPTPVNNTGAYYSTLNGTVQSTNGSGRVLTFTKLGTAGNLFTILDGSVNRVAVNNDLNSVVFIHRANPDSTQNFPNVPPNDVNVGMYTYDVSTDLGGSWATDNGILNPQGNNVDLAGRYPNVTLYNPTGNTNLSNAYLSYLGSWLPFSAGSADWDGFFYGVASLDGNVSTVTADTTSFNNGDVSIATGLCQSAPGVFWATDFESDGTAFDEILLYKGVWNPSSSNVDWFLDQKFAPGYDISFDGTTQVTAVNMDFDPSGQYGWIVCTGDATPGGNNVMNPIFYNTIDGGNTWVGPTVLDLSTFDNIMAKMPDPLVDIPQTGFDCDIVVDINGNPHVAFTIGAGSDYALTTTTAPAFGVINMWDITRQPGASKGCEWQAIWLDSLSTFRGAITADISEDNRPQASSSEDGRYVFFGWGDSGLNSVAGDNSSPNLRTRAIDVTTGNASLAVDQTTGTDFEGAAFFSSFAPTCIEQGNMLSAAVVFGQINPITLNEEDPAFFYFVGGVEYDKTSDFTIDVYPPVASLVGSNPLTIVNGTAYVEAGATATDNVDGAIAFGGFTTTGTVNTNVDGAYTITYEVSDAAGNAACVLTRTVNVVAAADVTPPTITLIGADTVYADICEFFTDQGATANDNVDGDISANVTVVSNVLNGTPTTPGTAGTYTITYSVSDGAGNSNSETRTVILTDDAPTITLVGGNTATVEICDSYVDPGFFGFDNCIGIVPVTVTGSVDTSTVGTYTLTYIASDGNFSDTATRVVTVTADATPPTITLAGQSLVNLYIGTAYVDEGFTASDCSGATIVSDVATSLNNTVAGTYVITYTATDGAGLISTATRTVNVGTEPDAAFTYNTNNGTRYTFTDASLNSPTSWVWDFGDGSNSQQQDPTYTFTADGSYLVCLTAKNLFNNAPFNKTEDSTCQTIVVSGVGIQDLSVLEAAFQVYPNPTSGLLNLDVKDMSFETMDVEVINVIGEVHIAKNFKQVQAQSHLSIDMSGLSNGIYFIRINTNQGVITKRVSLNAF